MKNLLFTWTLFSIFTLTAQAEISMPSFFSDGMVLQQKSSAQLWGWAESGTQVSAHFANHKTTATTNSDGKWAIEFKNLEASKKGTDLTIKIGNESKIIKDVVVGEVWIASGQSNMEWPMKRLKNSEEDNNATDKLLRVFVSRNHTAEKPLRDFPGTWLSTTPQNTAKFTAVGYHFAKDLRKKLDVPVGIIECAWGGKRIEPFISDASMKQTKNLHYLVEAKQNAIDKYSLEEEQKKLAPSLEAWKKKDAEWQKNKEGRRPRKPTLKPAPKLHPNFHSTIYNGMISPITGYSARGVLWYQGESNANDTSANDYAELLKLLIQDWRKQWGSNLSFYYVQLASYGDKKRTGWVTVQDEMRQLLNDTEMNQTNIGMAVITDIGHPTNIHPPNKHDVGKRLARWALHKDYGMKDVVVSGPLYKAHNIKAGKLEITFDHSLGLNTRDSKSPGAFELLDANNNWLPAEASIEGDKILLSNDTIKNPTKARYAWDCLAEGANLINAEGLPASCFTTE